MRRYRIYVPSTGRLIVSLAPKLILADPLPEWEFKPRVAGKPNSNNVRRDVEI